MPGPIKSLSNYYYANTTDNSGNDVEVLDVPEDAEDTSMTSDDKKNYDIIIGLTAGLPAIFIGFGIFIWYRVMTQGQREWTIAKLESFGTPFLLMFQAVYNATAFSYATKLATIVGFLFALTILLSIIITPIMMSILSQKEEFTDNSDDSEKIAEDAGNITKDLIMSKTLSFSDFWNTHFKSSFSVSETLAAKSAFVNYSIQAWYGFLILVCATHNIVD